MGKLGSVFVAFALLGTVAIADAGPVGMHDATELKCKPRSECCKVCKRGQACGDSCISRKKQCHQPPGCACDAADVCR